MANPRSASSRRSRTLADDTFSPVYFRNATAYGVSRRLRADIVVNNLVGYAVTTGKVLLKSDGSPWRPLVHIRDIIGAMSAALTAPRDSIHDQAFNVGKNGENYRIRDVANMVAEVVPNCEVAFAEGASADIRNYRVDFTKAETKLPGFAPAWTLRAGIEELYNAYTGRRADCRGVPGTTLLSAEDRAGPHRPWRARFDATLGQLSRRSISSLSRNDSCTMVSVEFAYPPEGKTDEPPTYRFRVPWTRRFRSTMP